MRSLASLVLVVAIGLGVYCFYFRQVQPGGSGTVPTQAISLTGVQNDLIAIAQAERAHFAENGSYVSLADLTSSGALSMPRQGRDGYTYSVETSANSFTATARYTGPPGGPYHPTLTVDQTIEVRQMD